MYSQYITLCTYIPSCQNKNQIQSVVDLYNNLCDSWDNIIDIEAAKLRKSQQQRLIDTILDLSKTMQEDIKQRIEEASAQFNTQNKQPIIVTGFTKN